MDVLLSGQLAFSVAVLGAVYAVVGLGLNLVYGTMRLLNVGHGDLVMLGAYVAFWGFSLFGLSPLLGAPVAALLAALLGLTLYGGVFRRLLEADGPGGRLEANSLLVFLGLSVVLQNAGALAFTASPRALRHLDEVIRVGGVAMTENRLAILLVGVAACVGTILFLRLSIHGLAIKALIDNRRAARIVGVDVDRTQRLSIALGFGLAGLAGALLGMIEQISPFMGFPYTVAAFVVIVLGGLGRLAGGVAAGFVLAAVQVYGVALTAPTYASVLLYGVFVAVLLLRPQGMAGGRART